MYITEKSDTFEEIYQAASAYTDKQLSVFWLPDEINVEKDKDDILVNMTDTERKAVTEVLKLFTLYEREAGEGYWGGIFFQQFTRPELRRMATTFNFFETAIHAPFYKKLNSVLGLDNDQFLHSYKEIDALNERMNTIKSIVKCDDTLLGVAAFTFIEGAVLYSSFAFLLHFQANSKDLLRNVGRGLKFSVRDENIHAEAGAWVFRTMLHESDDSELTTTIRQQAIYKIADIILKQETALISRIFEGGDIEGITENQLYEFAKHRVNLCLSNLGLVPAYTVIDDTVATWFYKLINGFSLNDSFAGVGNSYVRSWDSSRFLW